MAKRNYMRVVIANDSDATLRLRHHWTDGDWTEHWHPEGSREARPGESVAWQAEGDTLTGVPLDGVEARAWYDVIDRRGGVVGELYVFANSPLIESIYGNTFHVRSPDGYCAAYVDQRAQKIGNRAILDISFRKSKKVAVPNFLPSRNGFRFSNDWSDQLPVMTLGRLWNILVEALPGEIAEAVGVPGISDDWGPVLTNAGQGLCGGMCYAVMDYYNAGQLPPTTAAPPDGANDPLFLHIRDRLLDSFDAGGRGHRWISYSSPIYPDDDEGVMQALGLMKGKAWVSYREEWPRIREEIDRGRLATIGLVRTDSFDIGENHQVLAYAYQQSGQKVTLWVYDPNEPGDDNVTLTFDITDTASPVRMSHSISDKRIFALLLLDNYQPKLAPAGRPLPPPGRPPTLRLVEGDGRSSTVGGEVTHETVNECQEPLRTGKWIMTTTLAFVAQISGFNAPHVDWFVNGVAVGAEGTSRIAIDTGGVAHGLSVTLAPGRLVLTLTSDAGDSLAGTVQVEVRDAAGNADQAEAEFAIDGDYEGIMIEDLAAAVQCAARLIPVPVDIYTVPKERPGPVEEPVDIGEWARDARTRLGRDPSIDDVTRAKVGNYIDQQEVTPAIRLVDRVRLNRDIIINR